MLTSISRFTLGLLLPGAASAAVAADRPNIVIVLADDLGYADLGCYGGTDIPTPHIDALARNGARFTHAYTSGCVCSPTRAGLMTGRYQQRFGFEANAEGAARADRGPRALDAAQVIFPQRLKALGYATGLVGKWHLGSGPGYLPTERGFDEFYGLLPYGLAAGSHGPTREPVPIYRGTRAVEIPADHMAKFGDEAVDFIDRHQRTPFFLYLAFTAVHGPFVGQPRYREKFATLTPAARATYAADLNQMDDIVGRVMAALRERGLVENTLVFFLGDNGGPAGANGVVRNGVLRGGKWTLWDGGIRVPLIAHWPGRIPAGRTLAPPAIQLDLLPTALAAARIEASPAWRLDGSNLLPLLEGRSEAAPHEALFWRFGPQYAVRAGNWKLLKPRLDASPQLYDLAVDPGESNDLAAREPARLAALQARWDRWNADNESPRWIDPRWNGDGPAPRPAAAGK